MSNWIHFFLSFSALSSDEMVFVWLWHLLVANSEKNTEQSRNQRKTYSKLRNCNSYYKKRLSAFFAYSNQFWCFVKTIRNGFSQTSATATKKEKYDFATNCFHFLDQKKFTESKKAVKTACWLRDLIEIAELRLNLTIRVVHSSNNQTIATYLGRNNFFLYKTRIF